MSLTPGGMKDGRDNVLKLMKILWNPQDTLRVFHVTGSNGKWSVCQMISQVLWKAFWKRIGLFTSPHFIDINERFQINGIKISDENLEKYYLHVLELTKKHDIALSFFEIQVVVMILYFVDEKVDYAVVEVGLGGTYDGTNIFSSPLACFITSITREHTHVLGKSRSTILKNKLGIVKPGVHLYTPLDNKQIHIACRKLGANLHTVKKDNQIKTNLPGKHQEKNARMVFEALRDTGMDEEKIRIGLRDIYNPGRFEWLNDHTLVDTANNEENIRILQNMIKSLKIRKEVVILFGTTQTEKDYAQKLSEMIPWDKIILVDDFCDRSLPCSEYLWKKKNVNIIHYFSDREKIQKILKDASKIKIIYGSLYLIGEIMRVSRYKPFA
jgi:dihydrofolate synthase/folylpolyglutamate synthase